MTAIAPKFMRAAAIERFGEVEEIKLMNVAVPSLEAGDVLIRMEAAGVGAWDPFERRGGFAKKLGVSPSFPHVLGSDGAGVIEAVGSDVGEFKVGDKVYAFTQITARGGFYAEYAAAKAEHVSLMPPGMTAVQAAAMAVDAVTALRGLEDTLRLQAGETLMLFGSSGGIGHLALQLAKRMGVRVFAVASGKDGVELSRKLGADEVVCGRSQDVLEHAARFAPEGLDAAFMTAGGKAANEALHALKSTGRLAYPSGCTPPEPPPYINAQVFSGMADRKILDRLSGHLEKLPLHVEVAEIFTLANAADAHRRLETHFLGKLALTP